MVTSKYIIKEQDNKDVIHQFKTLHENEVSSIAKNLNLSHGYVDWIIDVFLSNKRNYNCEIARRNPVKRRINTQVYNGIYLIGEYTSIKEACSDINTNLKSVYMAFKRYPNRNKVSVYHSKIKKTYTYVKIL